MSEQEFVDAVRSFLCRHGYIRRAECHFDGDSDVLADVELALEEKHWPAEMPGRLLLEAKSHHSLDSPNTINKAFGQLLKEANKSTNTRAQQSHCLGLLIPVDGAAWRNSKGNPVRRDSGIEYYRTGFQRIDAEIFAGFGRLVNARYVLAFSVHEQYLAVFGWDAFHAGDPPLARLTAPSLPH
jgi:hypothetical protein